MVPHGTTGIYMDPHEICNGLGLDGVKLMLGDAQHTPLKAMLTISSRVPAVPGFEDTGSFVGPSDVAEAMAWPQTVGLGEMMKLSRHSGWHRPHSRSGRRSAFGRQNRHGTLLDTRGEPGAQRLHRCCRESTRAEDALAKMRLGMYAQLRYGSAWKDLPALADVIATRDIDTRFACLISDDTHPHTLAGEGHFDHMDVCKEMQVLSLSARSLSKADLVSGVFFLHPHHVE